MAVLAHVVGGPAAQANAEPTPLPPQVYNKDTRDGWHLQIRIHNEVINSVPNLAAAANSREGFVTAAGTAVAAPAEQGEKPGVATVAAVAACVPVTPSQSDTSMFAIRTT